jgi:glutamyl-tRNA reductase
VSQHGAAELLGFGISHKTAPVAVRERLALSDRDASRFVQELVTRASIHEAVAISTCNRTEVYLVTDDQVQAEAELLGTLARRAGIRPTELAGVVYSPRNCDAARQLYRVVAGLESMVVGEAEVQGQVKRAYEAALEAGTTGPLTNRLFTAALQTGKRVRTETSLGASRTSVASVAVDLAARAVGDLARRDVIIIGAGDASETTAKALATRGVRTIFVANRHAARARSMAAQVGGRVSSLHDLPELLESADMVVASTSSPHAIVEAEEVEIVMRRRSDRPLVLIDIAVPRDIDPACGDVPGVTLYDIDDLQAVVARNLDVREGDRERAEAVVEDEIQRFARWLAQMDVRPTVAELREHGAKIVDQVLSENAGRWEAASEKDLARVDAIARAVMRRLLHEPTARLKALPTDGAHGRLQVARELFGLEGGSEAGGEDAVDELDGLPAAPPPADEARRPSAS